MPTKNFFARTAYTYSGSPWMLWLSTLTQALLAFLFLGPERHSSPISMWIGILCVFTTLLYAGSLIYYVTHRTELAANPARPINTRVFIWSGGITLIVIALFVVLESIVWRH